MDTLNILEEKKKQITGQGSELFSTITYVDSIFSTQNAVFAKVNALDVRTFIVEFKKRTLIGSAMFNLCPLFKHIPRLKCLPVLSQQRDFSCLKADLFLSKVRQDLRIKYNPISCILLKFSNTNFLVP